MTLFTNFSDYEQKFSNFDQKILTIIEQLAPHASDKDKLTIEAIRKNFKLKTTDFFRENRKLNIAVVGQVKAGKSSFLNALLFNGQEILPKASTPKTATLTKIEYSEKNQLLIEYYSQEEWNIIEDNAKVDVDAEVFKSAKELVEMVANSGVNVTTTLSKKQEVIDYESYEALMGSLNHYVGEDGKFTPLVKSVTMYMNKEELKEISIVDTPGLNDPIVSRTLRTKEFIEMCDIVFFLSQSSNFLDKSDWNLLSSQLPQKGVKRLVLIASKFDSGIIDVLKKKEEDSFFAAFEGFEEFEDTNSTDSIPRACEIIIDKLSSRTREKVSEFIQDLKRRQSSSEMIAVLEQIKQPIFISSIANNMLNKSYSELSSEERVIYDALNEFSTNMEEDLHSLSNLNQVKEIFESIVKNKEQILAAKAETFVPLAMEELKQTLVELRTYAEKRMAIIDSNEREQLQKQKDKIEAQISVVQAEIITQFSTINNDLEVEKVKLAKELRDASVQYSELEELTGTETKQGSRVVSTSKWYKPWSWGSTSTEYYTYEEVYSYLRLSDALDNLNQFVLESCNHIDSLFLNILSIKELKRNMLNVIINNFNTASEDFDASFYKMIVEKNIQSIEFPLIKINKQQIQEHLATTVSATARNSEDKKKLKQMLNTALSQAFDEISSEMYEQVGTFKKQLINIGDKLSVSLLQSINEEFNVLLAKFNEKEKEIEHYRQYIYELTTQIKAL